MKQQLFHHLHSYSPTDLWEQQCREKMLELLHGTSPFLRSSLPAHFTASACIVDPIHKKMLLVHHGKYDFWVQLGGHIESHDKTVEEGARREAMEEGGIQDLAPAREIFDIDIHMVSARPEEPAHEHFDVRYLYEYDSTRPIVLSEESKDIRWLGFDEICTLTREESMLRMVRKVTGK